MDTKKKERDELLFILAKSMGAEIIQWNNVDETVNQGITITKLVDTSSYISKEENKKLVLKSNVY